MKRIFYTLALIFVSYITVANHSVFDMAGGSGVDVSYKSSQKELVISVDKTTPSYIEVYNILGSRVMIVPLNNENTRVNLSKLPDGQYIVKVSTSTGKLLTVKKVAVY